MTKKRRNLRKHLDFSPICATIQESTKGDADGSAERMDLNEKTAGRLGLPFWAIQFDQT